MYGALLTAAWGAWRFKARVAGLPRVVLRSGVRRLFRQIWSCLVINMRCRSEVLGPREACGARRGVSICWTRGMVQAECYSVRARTFTCERQGSQKTVSRQPRTSSKLRKRIPFVTWEQQT